MGPRIETWPQNLKTVADLMVASRFPMFIAWGPELVLLYNDSYASILGTKHPPALGARFIDVWSDIWGDILPFIDSALAGKATWIENLHDLEGLLGLVEIGVIELHPWAATVDDYEHADTLIFDLDPGPGFAWSSLVEVAFALKDLLSAEGLTTWPKLTGGKGLHVMAPLQRKITHDRAHAYAKSIARRLRATAPRFLITTADPELRQGRLFIDYLRNGRGTMAVGAFSPRARPGFSVAAPTTWRRVKAGISPTAYTVSKPPGRHR